MPSKPSKDKPPRLTLLREEKLHRLLIGKKKESRLEASGVTVVKDRVALVVFDNMNQVARIDLSLKPHTENKLTPVPSLGNGFEDICIDYHNNHVLCLIEAIEDVDGLYRGFVSEYDTSGHFIRCTRLPTPFQNLNKGFEGITHLFMRGREHLFALCEGNLGTKAKQGGGLIEVFIRNEEGGWDFTYHISLPETAEFKDYAALTFRYDQLAIVSQESARLWVAKVDLKARALVHGTDRVYRFPSKEYANVEGIAWLTKNTLVAVSDKKKRNQRKRAANKDQSIHVFRLPRQSRTRSTR